MLCFVLLVILLFGPAIHCVVLCIASNIVICAGNTLHKVFVGDRLLNKSFSRKYACNIFFTKVFIYRIY